MIRAKAPTSINVKERIEIDLPNTLKEAINLAKLNNADLLIAKLDYQIAEKDLIIEKARLAPSASINYSKSENKDYSSTINELDQESVKATITWPIIKGGENISPREIDDVLYQHPNVIEAAAFGVKCDHYGEKIGVGIVLKENKMNFYLVKVTKLFYWPFYRNGFFYGNK